MAGARTVFDPAPMSPEHIERDYVRYLDDRDGQTGEKRNARLTAGLAHGFVADDPSAAASLSSVHQGEEFGVDLFMGIGSERQLMMRIAAQERDHVTILASLLGAFGGQPRARPLPAMLRHFLRWVVRLPDQAMALPLFLSELAGIAVFLAVRSHIIAHWDETPHFERAPQLLDDLIVDEVGHVALHHACLGPWQLRLARWVGRPFFWVFGVREPIAAALMRRLGRGEFRWTDIPEEILVSSWAPAATCADPAV